MSIHLFTIGDIQNITHTGLHGQCATSVDTKLEPGPAGPPPPRQMSRYSQLSYGITGGEGRQEGGQAAGREGSGPQDSIYFLTSTEIFQRLTRF